MATAKNINYMKPVEPTVDEILVVTSGAQRILDYLLTRPYTEVVELIPFLVSARKTT